MLVETKLWRNNQMRREVVAQTLDYVAALSRIGYEAFEAAIQRGQNSPKQLFNLVRDHPEALEESSFIDAVSNNLRRGRMVAIALGDGIRTETESLAQLLQSHAGAHFTFALVELSVWKNAIGDLLVVPGTLAKTVMIERGIVRVEQGVATIHPLPRQEQLGPQSITSTDFWETIAARNAALPALIHDLLAKLEPLGVYSDLKASLSLKVDLPERTKPINLGYIMKNGQFWTDTMARTEAERIWKPYMERLSDMIGGMVKNGPGTPYVSSNGESAPRIEQFLPKHQEELVQAIADLLQAIQDEAD